MKQYKNLLGVTLGTGFVPGLSLIKSFYWRDNAAGGDIWCFRVKKYPEYIVEESVSIRAVMRVYAERSGDTGVHTRKRSLRVPRVFARVTGGLLLRLSRIRELAGMRWRLPLLQSMASS